MMGAGIPPRRPFVPRATAPVRGTYPVAPGYPTRPETSIPESFFPFLIAERRLPELCKRYRKLYFSQDLTHEIAHWCNSISKLDGKIPTDVPTNLATDGEKTVPLPSWFVESQKATQETTESSTEHKYSVRVMLLSPAKPPAETDAKVKPAKPHPMQRIQFIVAMKEKGIMTPLGGDWKAQDGSDPTKDATLQKTAIRCVKEMVGLDLSPCKQWTKFIEVQYRRKSGETHHTVVLLPDVWKAFGELSSKTELAKAIVKEQKEVEEEVETEVEEDEPTAKEEKKEGEEKEEGKPEEKQEPKKIKVKKMVKRKVSKEVDKVVLKPTEMTLAALLDYNTYETGEDTVEACLFASAFDEMLSYFNATKILPFLRKTKHEFDEKAVVLKRKREEETAERQVQLEKAKGEAEAKRQKLNEELKAKEEKVRAKQEYQAKLAEEMKAMTEEERAARLEVEKAKEEEEKKAEDEKKKIEDEEKKKQLEEKERVRQEEVKKVQEAAKAKLEEEAAKAKAQEAEDHERGYRIVKHSVPTVNEEILLPFQYFDRPSGVSGHLRRETLEGLLHALGELTQREVDGLLRGVGLSAEPRASTPLNYRALATHVVVEEKKEPIAAVEEPAKAEEAEADPADEMASDEAAAQ